MNQMILTAEQHGNITTEIKSHNLASTNLSLLLANNSLSPVSLASDLPDRERVCKIYQCLKPIFSQSEAL